MNKHFGGGPGRNSTRGDVPTPVPIGVAGTILILGVGAAHLLDRASAAALATTSGVLITVGLVGLAVMLCIVAVGRFHPRRGNGNGPGDGQPFQLIPASPTVDLDRELFRILDDARLADLSSYREVRRRRSGAA